jgi:uncharacterized membrane protein (UPF0127 family)
MTSWLLILFSLSTNAVVSFDSIDIQVGGKRAHVQLADNDDRREHGLMFVKKLGLNEGMLFVFEEERPLNFWMKNTLIPLSIGFFDHDGVLVDVKEMKPAESLMEKHPPTYQSAEPATFALEMPEGWFSKNHLKAGAKLAVLKGGRSALLKQKVQFSSRQTSSRLSH